MPWEEVTKMNRRMEFVSLARHGSMSMSELCRRFGISRKTGYKWLGRGNTAVATGDSVEQSLRDVSRRPHHSPDRTDAAMEAVVVDARKEMGWGGRKIAAYLVDTLGYAPAVVPSPSTITEILRRHDRLNNEAGVQVTPYIRFEHPFSNDLWQMDFKGDFLLGGSTSRCYPLTVLDDHSRYSLCLQACANQRSVTVQERLRGTFRIYGLPLRMNVDNGSPWGGCGVRRYTALTAWLMQLGIRVSYSQPYHPQTQGKLERFHRSLKAELISRYSHSWNELNQCQQGFDGWQQVYNTQRPHESLEMKPPSCRYQVSSRCYPEVLPEVESYYAPGDLLRKVDDNGKISFKGHGFQVGSAFTGHRVALRPIANEAWEVFFCAQRVAKVNLKEAISGKEVD